LAFVTLVGTRAAEAAPTVADTLFQEGRTAANAGDYATALSKFTASQALEPAAGTLLNIADCEEHLGHPAAALAAFRQALRRLDSNDERTAIAVEHVRALDKRVARLVIRPQSPPHDARVLRDGVVLTPDEIGVPIEVEPGAHVIVGEGGASPARRLRVTVGEGQTMPVALVWSAPPTADATAAESSDRSGRRVAGYVAAGIGVAGLGLALISWREMVGAKGTLDRSCDPGTRTCSGPDARAALDAQDSGRTWRAVNYASFGVAAVGLGTGAFLILTSSSSARARVAITPRGDGVALTASGRF
jgi:hypothetical protein